MNLLYLNSNKMGEGDPELGEKILMLYLTKLLSNSVKIDAVVCVNSATFLTTTNKESIELLKQFEKQGAVISSCGTCLDFYEIRAQLKVGNVGSMDLVVQLMQQSEKIYRP